MQEFIPGFILGVMVSLLSIGVIAYATVASANNTCEANNWEGKACQCRIALGYNK